MGEPKVLCVLLIVEVVEDSQVRVQILIESLVGLQLPQGGLKTEEIALVLRHRVDSLDAELLSHVALELLCDGAVLSVKFPRYFEMFRLVLFEDLIVLEDTVEVSLHAILSRLLKDVAHCLSLVIYEQ